MILSIIYMAAAAILLLASLTYGFVFNFMACVAMAAATVLVAILQGLSELKSMFRKTGEAGTRSSDRLGASHSSPNKAGAQSGEKVAYNSIPPFRSTV